ncbi:MAG: MlaE family lipid ABC transporter permease subunit [Gammaproteobacteria bacterium]|nr:MlaE family lipid ABC transporter permease subunit [Gammaproteobacteria bacterium]
MSPAKITIVNNNTALHIKSSGSWTHKSIQSVYEQLKIFSIHPEVQSISWDFSDTEDLDTSGIMIIIQFMRRFDASRVTFTYVKMKPEHQRMFLFYRKNFIQSSPLSTGKHSFFYSLGKGFAEFAQGFMAFNYFIGINAYQFWLSILSPSLFRFKAIVKHLYTSGLQALPIVGLTSFLVGLVIAYQSAEQLQQFGASIFIVEMVSISVFRELAPMISAIVVAGRSASAYTAEIGIMKITEEIDAMQTMGFEPHRFLVLPRVIALMLAMPLVIFFADMLGIFGGMLIAKGQLGLTFSEFVARLHTEVPIKHILIGLIKAPFFGLIIALIGCFRGFQVTGSTDSIGKFTTISVVNASFWVIAINALISVVLTELGI